MSSQAALECTVENINIPVMVRGLGLADRGISILLFSVCSRISRLFVFEE